MTSFRNTLYFSKHFLRHFYFLLSLLPYFLVYSILLLSSPTLYARGNSPARQSSSQAGQADQASRAGLPQIPEELQSKEQQAAYLSLWRVEKKAESYPARQVFLEFPDSPLTLNSASRQIANSPTSNARNRPLQIEVSKIWLQPSLYELFLWLGSFGLLSSLDQKSLETLGQSFLQVLYSGGDLRQRPEGELGSIYVRNFFVADAQSPYPGKAAWLVFRVFLDPYNANDLGARRISILYNAYIEAAGTDSSVEPMQIGALQRSSAFPIKDGKLSYRYVYLLPHSSLSSQEQSGSKKSDMAPPNSALEAVPNADPKVNADAESADTEETNTENNGDSLLEDTGLQIDSQEDLQAGDEPILANPDNNFRLSFIADPYAQLAIHPRYSPAKYLQILRDYLRDNIADNDQKVPPASNYLSRQAIDADTYSLQQEMILYYYMLYLPSRSEPFIQSVQNQWRLNGASSQIRNLWRIQIPKIWAAITTLRQRYENSYKEILPGAN